MTPTNHDHAAVPPRSRGRALRSLALTVSAAAAATGVAVIRQGTSVGLVLAYGDWRSPTQTVESVAKVSVDRLA